MLVNLSPLHQQRLHHIHDILFHNSDFIAKESKELQTELSKYAFLKNDVFNTGETKLFLNKINIFLSKIKTEDELAHITKDNDKAKAQLQKALKIKKEIKSECLVNPIKSSGYPYLAKRPKYSVLNCDKINKDFNFDIRSWQLGVEHCIRQILN